MTTPGRYKWFIWLLGIVLLGSLQLSAQNDALKKANDFFNESDYASALLHLNKIGNIQNSAPLLLKRAICYYEINDLDKTIAELAQIRNMGLKDDRLHYYLARSYHHKGNFNQAADTYKKYLEETDLADVRRQEVRDHLRNCGAAMDILYIEPIASIVNAGPEINSKFNEERMIQSIGKIDRFYFNTDRPDRDNEVASYLSKSYKIDASSDMDIFLVDRVQNTWAQAEKLGDRSVNTYKNDFLNDLSLDGSSLYLYRGKDKVELVIQSSSAEAKRRMALLNEMVPDIGSFHMFNDSTVVLSAQLPDNLGGYDLYVTAFVNNKWLAPENLGRNINSPKNEITPYLTNDGSTLYFSSDRSFCVGGYDVFESRFLFEQKKWTSPSNLGIPINSPGNETHYRLNDDGLMATYTSDRKDGYGRQDIYFAYLNERNEHQGFTVRDLSFVDYPDFYLKEKEDRPKPPRVEQEVEVAVVTSDQNTQIPEITEESKPQSPSNIKLPLLFQNEAGDILTKENILKINDLANILKAYPDLQLEVMSFSHQGAIAEYNLFLSIKNAEKIKDALLEQQVDAGRITIKGLGDFLPLVKESIEIEEIQKLNNRIEFKINMPPSNLLVENESLDINKNYLNKGYDIFRTLIDDAVSYKIQIATVRQMYRGTALKLYNDVQVEKDAQTGNYLYSIGLYNDFIEANNIMRELAEKGITALKIVPYIDGMRILEKNLVNYADRYPELKEYIRSVSYAEPND